MHQTIPEGDHHLLFGPERSRSLDQQDLKITSQEQYSLTVVTFGNPRKSRLYSTLGSHRQCQFSRCLRVSPKTRKGYSFALHYRTLFNVFRHPYAWLDSPSKYARRYLSHISPLWCSSAAETFFLVKENSMEERTRAKVTEHNK